MTWGFRRILLGVCAIGLASASFSGSGVAHPGRLHIHELHASVPTINGTQWVRVRAKVCVRSNAEALRSYPDEFRLTQFLVQKGRWKPVRVLIDPAPQCLVPLGEMWRGRACGWVTFEDVFKYVEGFAGFGSSIECFGVAFSIRVSGKTATKRDTVRCGTG